MKILINYFSQLLQQKKSRYVSWLLTYFSKDISFYPERSPDSNASPWTMRLPLLLAHLLSSCLFRSSSGLCEFVSRWAQTPAPHFLPHSLSSGRSGTHSLHLMYIIRSRIHQYSHSSRGQVDLRACLSALSELLSQRCQNVAALSPTSAHRTA